MTIMKACVEVLKRSQRPLTADEIFAEIQHRKLFDFKAKDPRSIVRSTLRKHLKGPGPHRVRQVDSNRYEILS